MNTAVMGCFNFLVGQTIFKNMFEVIMLATKSSKMNPSTALASFFMEGGSRWKAFKDGVRLPYYSPEGVIKAINLIPGGFFKAGQLQLMHNPRLFNIMVAAKTRTRGALIRLDHVQMFSHRSKTAGVDEHDVFMKPSVTSTLIAVRLVLNKQGVKLPEIPVSQYMISIGGAQAFSAFGEGNEKPSEEFAEMLDGVDFAQVFVPSEYSKSEAMQYWLDQGFVKGKVQAGGLSARIGRSLAA